MSLDELSSKLDELTEIMKHEKDLVNNFVIMNEWEFVVHWQWRAFCTMKAMRKLAKLEKEWRLEVNN